MTYKTIKRIKGTNYVYLVNSFRFKGKIKKISKLLGKEAGLSKADIRKAMKKFALEINQKIINEKLKGIKKNTKLIYPIIIDEVKKIEEMNLKYHKILKSIGKNNLEDFKKRFVANFVFESNALEGNSLTLKNYREILFENRISKGKDLREIYDAQNSYSVFKKLFDSRKEITEKFIIHIHKNIVKNIDSRIGYKKLPNEIIGRRMKLSEPKNVKKDMGNLLKWYENNIEKIYPLELAFKFHHKFEKIHPFSDGNGRVGRMLLNYILIKNNYFPIIIRNSQRLKYIKALEVADSNQFSPLMWFALKRAKDTYRKFFEIYYKYSK